MVMQRRNELKLVLLSATTEVQHVQGHFEGAPLLSLPIRTHPVDIMYTQEMEKDYVKAAIRTVIQIHTTETEGDILLFLPTEDEIDNVCQILRKEATQLMLSGELIVRTVYVGLPQNETQRAFDAAPAAKILAGTGGKPGRKCVVATSVCESSICMDGITYVIDASLAKQQVYNPRSRIDSPVVAPISRAAAGNRALLAGRTRPGKVFRLCSQKAFKEDLPELIPPEIMSGSGSYARSADVWGLGLLLH